MRLFRRRKVESLPKARSRAQKFGIGDLYNWADHQTMTIGQTLSYWRRGAGNEAMDEIEQQILVLLEVCRELKARQQS